LALTAAAAAAASWSLLCRRHEDMSARLLEYAVDQQCMDISRQQLRLIHSIISGGSSSSSSSSGMVCNGSSSSSSQQWGCSNAPWMLQVGAMHCVVVARADDEALLCETSAVAYVLCSLLMHWPFANAGYVHLVSLAPLTSVSHLVSLAPLTSVSHLVSLASLTSVSHLVSLASLTSVSHLVSLAPLTSVSHLVLLAPLTSVSHLVSLAPLTSVSHLVSLAPLTRVSQRLVLATMLVPASAHAHVSLLVAWLNI
jgi:hypothetical protein